MRNIYLLLSVLFLGFSACNQKQTPTVPENGNKPGFYEQELMKIINPYTGVVESDKLWNYFLSGSSTLGNKTLNKLTLEYVNTWRPVDDFFASLSIMRIVPDPHNEGVLYFCTGEGFLNEHPQKASSIARGAGVWKSTDFGDTWNLLPSTMNDSFIYSQDMVVHPISGDIYVGTLYGGLMRSKDGGDTWESVLGQTAENALTDRVADIEVTADGHLMVALGVWVSDGIYFSETGDAGDWEKRMSGITGSYHRIEMATAPSDSGRAYAITSNPSNNYRIGDIYVTDDKGLNWTAVNIPGNNPDALAKKQSWYDLIVKVDPENKDVLIAGGLNLWRSKDAGSSWKMLTDGHGAPPHLNAPGIKRGADTLPYVHVDQHEIVYHTSDTVFFGNDGGIYCSYNMTSDSPTFQNLNLNYNVTQYYACAIHPSAGHHSIIGGTQDNGSSGSTGQGITEWDMLSWADGGYCAIDPVDGRSYFTSTQYERVYRRVDGDLDTLTNSFLNDNNTLFINPIEIDPFEGKYLYQASTVGLWRLKDPETATKFQWKRACRGIGAISSIGISEDVPNTVFIGRTGGGRIYRINNSDQTDINYLPVNVDPNNELPTLGYSSSIFVDPEDANHVIASYSNYGIESIFESKNAMSNSPSWSNVEGDLPDIPVRWVSLHPTNNRVCYAATDAGVFFTTNLDGENTKWEPTNVGLANIRIDMIRYRKSDNLFVAATHGRGMFTGFADPVTHEIKWEERGPRNIGGRTRTILVDPWNSSGKELWAGSVSGGLWHINNIDSISETRLKYTYKPFSVIVFPNPSTDDVINVEITGGEGTKVKLELISIKGQTIMKEEVTVGLDGKAIYTIGSNNRHRVAAGLYFLKVVASGHEEVFRILYK